MGFSSDEITVGIGGTSAGLQAASAEGVASLRELQAALAALADSAKVVGAQLDMSGGAFVSAGTQTRGFTEEVTAAHEAQATMAEEMAGSGGIIGAMESMGTSVVSAAGNFRTLVETMAGLFVIQEAIGLFDQLTDSVKNAADAIFQLNVNTERNTFMWQYQYAQGGKPDPKIASQLAAFTNQFSYQAPFTRQDINTGIGAMAPMGLNLQGVEKYAPLIADLAATHASIFGTGGQLTFSQVAFALMEAMTTGNARRMMMELQIQPRQLEQFGLKFAGSGHVGGQILNPWDFLPDTLKLANQRGWTGAAQAAAHQTFWGELSSFQDRLQNTGLDIGGMNPDATTRQGSMFGSIKQDMEDLSAWYDAHHDDLMKLAGEIGDKGIGGALKLARDMATGFLAGLNQSGIGNDVLQQFMKAGQWMADPNHQQELKAFGEALGRDTGRNLQEIGDGLGHISDGLDAMHTALGPDGSKTIVDGLGHIGDAFKVVGWEIGGDLKMLADFTSMLGYMKSGDWGKALEAAKQYGVDLTYYATMGLAQLPGNPEDQGAGANASTGTTGPSNVGSKVVNNATGKVITVYGPYDKTQYTSVASITAATTAAAQARLLKDGDLERMLTHAGQGSPTIPAVTGNQLKQQGQQMAADITNGGLAALKNASKTLGPQLQATGNDLGKNLAQGLLDGLLSALPSPQQIANAVANKGNGTSTRTSNVNPALAPGSLRVFGNLGPF